jgi:uncharacterized membrane protein
MNVSGTELEFLREWTGWFCHKLPERSPQCAGEVFPVCFRCAGVQLGLAASYLGLFASHGWHRRFPAVRVVMRCVALMLPLMIDGLGNTLHLWNSPGWLWGLTGLGVGLSLPWLLSPLAQSLDRATDPARKPSLNGLRQMLLPALAGASAIMLLDRECGPMLFRVLAAVAAAGWILFLGHFILALVRAYGRVITWRVWPLFSRSEAKA